MAISIQSIPTLKKEDGKAFVEKADAILAKRASVDFIQEVKIAHKILDKAKMR